MFLRRVFAPDRRRQKRQLLNTSVTVFTGSRRIEALGINVSEVGMCLFTVANLPVDSRIELELPLPRSKEPVRLSAVIRHRALYLYGVEFVDNSEDETQRQTGAASTPHLVT